MPLSLVSMKPTIPGPISKEESNRKEETMKAPKVVLRFDRSTLARLNAITAHEQRTGGDLRHINASKTAENRVLIGSGDPGADIRERIAEMSGENLNEEVAALKAKRQHKAARERLRVGPKDPWDPKATKHLTRGVLSASPEWFTSPERVELFAERSQAWLEETFGESLVAASLHLDERTPHIHFELLPTVVKTSGRRGAQRLVAHRQHPAFAEVPGQVSSYERLQDEAGEVFADLGLDRGDRHAERARLDEFFGGKATPAPKNTPPAEWRAQRQAEALMLSAEAQAAELLGTARSAASKTRAEAQAFASAVQRGAEAVAAEEVVWRAPSPERPSASLRPGPAFPADKARGQALADALRPAWSWVVGFAERFGLAQAAARSKLSGDRDQLEADRRVLALDRSAFEGEKRAAAPALVVAKQVAAQAGDVGELARLRRAEDSLRGGNRRRADPEERA